MVTTNNIHVLRGTKPSGHSYLINNFTLVDIGAREQFSILRQHLASFDLMPEDITNVILTHAHYDHSGASEFFPNAQFYGSPLTKIALELQDEQLICSLKYGIEPPIYQNMIPLEDGDIFQDDWQIIHTPGHSADCICLYHKQLKILISGDTIFARGVPALITPSGSNTTLLHSVTKLQQYPIEVLYPGHGISELKPNLELTKNNILKRISQHAGTVKNEVSQCQKY